MLIDDPSPDYTSVPPSPSSLLAPSSSLFIVPSPSPSSGPIMEKSPSPTQTTLKRSVDFVMDSQDHNMSPPLKKKKAEEVEMDDFDSWIANMVNGNDMEER